jgi:cation:H+ antiporter
VYLPFFETRALWPNVGVFLVCSAALWVGGVRLAKLAKTIADRTNWGQALVGTLILGAVVSLPELAMAVAAAAAGNAGLAAGTLLGGIVFATLVLAVTDAFVGRHALSAEVATSVAPLQGTLLVLSLVLVACGMASADVPVLGAGAWTSSFVLLYVAILWLVKRAQKPPSRVPHDVDRERPSAEGHCASWSMRRVALLIALLSLAILIAGVLAAQTAETIARETGLGQSFMGLLLGGVVTTLPEMSSAYSAARLRQHQLVFSDIFGSNLFSVMLLFACDLASPRGPVLNELGSFALFGTLLGAALTLLYVAGLLCQPRPVFRRMGIDSLLVVVVGVAGLWLLYELR